MNLNINLNLDLKPNSRVVLLDSSGIIRSCYSGYRDALTSTYKGRAMDVNALHGYMYRTMKLYEQFDFDALIHVIDPPGGSFYRYSIYPEYKGQRKPGEPALAAQEALIQEVLDAFGERHIRMRGVESDDVIGTISDHLYKLGHTVMVVSSDKDLMQLVVDQQPDSEYGSICMARYIKDPQNPNRRTYASYTEDEVFDVLNIRPDQIVDYLALVGDSVDNIPGVKGIGPKKAHALLEQYGNLESIANNLPNISKKEGGEALQNALPHLELYQKLTRVIRDIPNIQIPEPVAVAEHDLFLLRDTICWPESYPSKFTNGEYIQYVPPLSASNHEQRPAVVEQPVQVQNTETTEKTTRYSYSQTKTTQTSNERETVEEQNIYAEEKVVVEQNKTVTSVAQPSPPLPSPSSRPTFSLTRRKP